METIKDFKLNSFLRTIWVSKNARSVWEHVLRDISVMVQNLEIDSVAAGHRRCAWRTIAMKTIPQFSKECSEKGLIVTPVKLVGNWGKGFIHYTPEARPDDPNPNVYCIISKNLQDAIGFRNAHDAGDHIVQGHYLGFPECCTKFFSEVWADGWFDPIFQIGKSDYLKHRKLFAHPYSNPILRYIGLRVGFHLPCSFSCEETISLSAHRLGKANKEDWGLVKLLRALLSMPMSWEVYKGVATVRTPIFYILTQSIPAAKKYTLEIPGTFVPREAERGVVFPFTEVKL